MSQQNEFFAADGPTKTSVGPEDAKGKMYLGSVSQGSSSRDTPTPACPTSPSSSPPTPPRYRGVNWLAPAKNWFPGDGAWTAGAHQKECVRPRHQSTHMLAGPSGGYKRELPTTDGAGKYKFEQSPMDPCVFMLRRWTGDGPQSPTWAAMWMTYSLGDHANYRSDSSRLGDEVRSSDLGVRQLRVLGV